MPPRSSPWARLAGAATMVGRDLDPASGERVRLLWPTARHAPWSARLPLLLAGACVVVLAVLGGAQGAMVVSGAPVAGALVFGLVHATPLVLCLYRPLAGWWLSLLGNTVLSGVVHGVDGIHGAAATSVWPETNLLAHLCVLGFVGVRLRPRILVELWVLTLAAGLVLVFLLSPDARLSDLDEMSVSSAVVLIAAGALRSSAESSKQVAEQRALTVDERQRRAVLEERSRIARELHDVLAHHMSVIAIQAEAAPYRVPEPPERLVDSFVMINTHAQEALTELRRVLGVLRSEDGDTDSEPQPTLSRVPDLVANARAAGLDVTVVLLGESVLLPSGIELSAYRIVQEGLNNVMRHAPGATVRVGIEYRPSQLRLEVVNGPSTTKTAWSGDHRSGHGHGVVGMRERVGMLKGELRVGRTSDGGYALEAVLPLDGGGR